MHVLMRCYWQRKLVQMTKGESLHNPFDLEKNPNIEWNGQILPGRDSVFCEFIDDIHGIRAGFIDIKNAIKAGRNTLALLIHAYAPPSENDTVMYISNVSKWTEILSDTVLMSDDVYEVGIAIIRQEQGTVSYTQDILEAAARLAGINYALQTPTN